jgi:hypothetical protein
MARMLYADATVVIPMDFLRVPLSRRRLADLSAAGHVHVLGATLILPGNLLNLKAAAPARFRPDRPPPAVRFS